MRDYPFDVEIAKNVFQARLGSNVKSAIKDAIELARLLDTSKQGSQGELTPYRLIWNRMAIEIHAEMDFEEVYAEVRKKL